MTFKEKIQQKFAQPEKVKVKKPLPYLTESVIQMRQHIGDFCRKHPRTGLVFNRSNHWYRIGWKYFGAEDLLQIAFCSYLAQYHKDVQVMHPKNESKSGRVEQAKKILMGVMPGASDCLLQCQGLPDAWIELKVKPNRLTPDQRKFLAFQDKQGNFTGVAFDLYECEELVKEWKKLK